MKMKPRTWVLRTDEDARSLFTFLKLNRTPLAEANTPLAVTAGLETTKRSIQANAYYWGVTLKQISEQAWIAGRLFSAAVWHEEFKERFSPRIDRPFGGSSPISTQDMTVGQFHDFNRDVEVFAAQELGVVFVDDLAIPAGWAA